MIARSRRRASTLCGAALGLVLAGCETTPNAPIEGPTAVLVEAASGGGKAGSAFFVLDQIDGRSVQNSIGASLRASAGRGADLTLVTRPQTVPAGRPVTLRLVGQYVYAMPIAQMISGGRNAVAGDLRVELRPGTVYRVNGVLDDYRSEVWIEEAATRIVVGEKVVRAASAREQQDARAADLFTCCNLHQSGGWISDGNYTTEPFIPAGAPVKVTGWGRNEVHANIAGRSIRAGVDHPSPVETREQLAARLFVREDPRLRVAAWSPDAQAAIAAGKARRGMTKEQVVVALGQPRKDRTPDMGAARWVYFSAEDEEFDIDFDAEGRAIGFNGVTRARQSAWLD